MLWHKPVHKLSPFLIGNRDNISIRKCNGYISDWTGQLFHPFHMFSII